MQQQKRKQIGQILCEKGSISPTQLQKALNEQRVRDGQRLGKILIDLGYITQNQLDKALDIQNCQKV